MNARLALKTLTAAMAAALAASPAANAITLSGYSEGDANTVTLRIGGSSAHDKGLLSLMRLTAAGGAEICQENTLHHYKVGSNDNIYACTAGAQSGVAGSKLVVIKKSSGGSGTGVATVVKSGTVNLDDGTTVNSTYLDPSNATLQAGTGFTTTSKAAEGALSAYTELSIGSSAGLTAASTTDVGISDAEPAVSRRLFNPDLKATELNAMAVKGISGVIFGVPVTRNVYQRLQALQFPTTSKCNPAGTGYGSITAAVDASNAANSEECMPSLTRDQVQGLYIGAIDWSSIASANAGSSANLTEVSGTGTTLNSSTVYLERRVSSSGTQRSYDIYFLGQGCLSGAPTFRTAAGEPGVVVENSSGSTIPANLNSHNTAGRGAIGVLTSESKPALADGWRFVKLNGYAPTVLNVVKGTYDLFYESTLQYRNTTVNGLSSLAAGTNGANEKKLADAIATNLGKPSVVSFLNTSFDQFFGRAGLVANAVSQAASAPVPPFTTGAAGSGVATDVYDKPVATSTRGTSGTPNACLFPVKVNLSQPAAQ